jgi:hypothetical protein
VLHRAGIRDETQGYGIISVSNTYPVIFAAKKLSNQLLKAQARVEISLWRLEFPLIPSSLFLKLIGAMSEYQEKNKPPNEAVRWAYNSY